ncbi:DUF3578 domain-containing protein [Streptomyces sp. NBS 14/10]|uniref:MrcB family domain-containing protein n=1 Tax=Streptomyces sp. NBS 14/10 TaxID=1945643 RepID=UPI000B7D5C07|nr:DUF3578 domain-containing protein [Streptomyces sp. NBS 14/10]KAK1180431.1 DUF3578 domain-containing protein [Streptomyces sp. NBS 14/10]
MGILDLLLDVASSYDAGKKNSKGLPAQDRLRAASGEWAHIVPVGFAAEGNGGSGGASKTPWIGVYDRDINLDPKKGLYLAYIFAEDLSTVTLTLQQGVTSLADELGTGKKRRDYLQNRAQALLAGLPDELVDGWRVRPDLKSKVHRARSYEAGSVVARCYSTASMPTEISLREDLWHMAEVLQHAAAVEKTLSGATISAGVGSKASSKKPPVEFQGLDGFRPKDGSDYVARIPKRTIKKSRSHELLLEAFSHYADERDFVPINKAMHPKDLVLRKDGVEWLVEAKTVKRGNPTKAVREAVGQLFEYNHFLYEQVGHAKPHLLALFTEDIGAYAAYLEGLGIASVWRTVDGWAGSASAATWGIVD